MEESKRVSDSETEQVHIVMYNEINGTKRLFGGVLVEWMDVVAAVVARRHSGCNVTTAAIDSLHFKSAAYVNETMVLKGKVTYVGTTSMEIRVDAYTESLDGIRKSVNTAYFILVALDENENSVRVPRLVCETDEEISEWQAGKTRFLKRKAVQRI